MHKWRIVTVRDTNLTANTLIPRRPKGFSAQKQSQNFSHKSSVRDILTGCAARVLVPPHEFWRPRTHRKRTGFVAAHLFCCEITVFLNTNLRKASVGGIWTSSSPINLNFKQSQNFSHNSSVRGILTLFEIQTDIQVSHQRIPMIVSVHDLILIGFGFCDL